MIIPDLAESLNQANSFNRGDGSAPPRIPLIFTCSSWAEKGIPAIALRINPHSIAFKQAKRITKRNTQGGTVYMHWSDDNGQNNDILELQFRGKTGNINLRKDVVRELSGLGSALRDAANWLGGLAHGGDAEPQPNAGPQKLMTWVRLYVLTRTAMIDVATKKKNVFYVVYRSPLFPRPVLFYGFFNNVLDFSETAEQPYLPEWSFSFIVQGTYPDLNMLTEYLSYVLSKPKAVGNEINKAIEASNDALQASVDYTNINFKQG